MFTRLDPILSQTNPVQILTCNIFRTHPVVNLPSAPKSLNLHFPSGFPARILYLFVFSLPALLRAPPISSYSVWLYWKYLMKNTHSSCSCSICNFVLPLVVSLLSQIPLCRSARDSFSQRTLPQDARRVFFGMRGWATHQHKRKSNPIFVYFNLTSSDVRREDRRRQAFR